MSGIKTVLNWSSGKDAALAYHALSNENEYDVCKLLTTVNAEADRVVMHGLREELLDMQAEAMGVPLQKIKLPASPTDVVYKTEMQKALEILKADGITTAAFGDIFLDDLKQYREAQLSTIGFNAVFPLWKRDTTELVRLLEDTGIEAMLVCVNGTLLAKEFLGRVVNRELLDDLPENVDPCGENGEFHTFVFNAPYFKNKIPVKKAEIIYKEYNLSSADGANANGYYFLDIVADK